MPDIPTPRAAASLAGALLSPLGDRWAHTKAVASRAMQLREAVPEPERDLLLVAAWWHDLGYAPGLIQTGMHQIDGARFLEEMAYPDRLVGLVAHHSAAQSEGAERGFLGIMRRWVREESPVADALWVADMTTGPRGEWLDYEARLDEILSRYGHGSIVSRAMISAKPDILAAIGRTEQRLARK